MQLKHKEDIVFMNFLKKVWSPTILCAFFIIFIVVDNRINNTTEYEIDANVVDITTTTSHKNGKMWNKYDIVVKYENGQRAYFKTFDTIIADKARKAKETGAIITIQYK